jgi:hypothetical protein
MPPDGADASLRTLLRLVSATQPRSGAGGVSPAPVGTVAIASMANEVTTKIRLNLIITGNVKAVIVERLNADGTWTKVGVFTDLNDVVIDKLIPGSSNTFRACAMAAANQTSEYSVPMTGFCT